MDAAPSSMPPPPVWLAGLARARHLPLVRRGWWLSASLGAVAGYGAAAAAGALPATLIGGSLLVVMALMGVVARNASAEAALPGSVRRGSLVRAAGFGLLLHGALLSLGWASGGVLLGAVAWYVLGACVVALSRPASVVALGVTVDPAPPPPTSRSTPELVAALRASTHEVRTTGDPVRLAELAEQRGTLIDELQARDPQLMRALLDEFVPPVPAPEDDDDRG
jgi:hypothetical protein